MSYRPGDIFYKQVTTFNASGVSTNTDSIPWVTFVRNGIDDFSAKVFTTNVDIGRYTVSGIIPSTYSLGNSVSVCVSGQVAGLLSKYIVDLGVLDTAYVGSLNNQWTAAEVNQMRYKIGLDGVATVPTSGYGHLELSASGWDQVMIESGVNARQAYTINSAVWAGTSSGNNLGNVIWYQGINAPGQNRLSSNAVSGIRSYVNVVLP